MYDNPTLAQTGGGIVLGSVVIGQMWLIAIALLLVTLGALAIRVGFRRGREVNS